MISAEKHRTLNRYINNDLLYFGFDGTVINKGDQLKINPKITTKFTQIKTQEHLYHTKRFYGLLMGRQYQDEDAYVVAIDIDNKSDDTCLNGLDFLKEYSYLFPDDTAIARTANGGYHYLFTVNEYYLNLLPASMTKIKVNGKIYNVDVKGRNQYLNCEPSKLDKTHKYEWLDKSKLSEIKPMLGLLLYMLLESAGKLPEDELVKKEVVKQDVVKQDVVNVSQTTQLLDCIKVETLSNYTDWLKIGMTLYSLDMSLELWDEYSQKAPNYTSNCCHSKWKYFNKKSFTLGTLIYYAKSDHPELYNKIDIKTLKEDILIKPTTINNKYITDEDIKVDINTNLIIKSPYNTGKSQFIFNYLKTQLDKRVLFITNRISLTKDIHRRFNELGFKSYLNYENDKSVYHSDKLIISINSLMKLYINNDETIINNKFNKFPDIIILDESESLLDHYSNDTLSVFQSERTWNFMRILLNKSTTNIFLDGDISNRTLSLVKSLKNKENKYIENLFKPERSKNLQIYSDTDEFKDTLNNNININKRIGIISQSMTRIEALEAEIKNKYSDINVLNIHRYTDETIKNPALDNINDYLINNNINVFLFSPTITVGVDITVKFDKVFGVLSEGSTNQRDFIQMINRYRNLEDLNIPIWNTGFPINNYTKYWHPAEVKEQHKQYVSDFIENDDGTITQKTMIDNPYYLNSVYNKVEELNKNKYIYLNYLKHLCDDKGYGYQLMSDKVVKAEATTTIKLNKIINAPDISHDDYYELKDMIERNLNITSSEKYSMDKYYYKELLVLDELTEDAIKPFYNNNLLNNYLAFKDDGNNLRKDMTDLKSNEFNEKLKLVRNICNTLNLSLNEEAVHLPNEFRDKFNNMESINPTKIREIFNLTKTYTVNNFDTNKKLIGYLNSVVLKEFSIKLKVKQISRHTSKYKYVLVADNGIEEVINRREERRRRDRWEDREDN